MKEFKKNNPQATDIGEHFTQEISPEYRICFIRKEKTCDD
jgi:hypothetical protein